MPGPAAWYRAGITIAAAACQEPVPVDERTIERKINEAFLASWLETHLSKKEILKLYLDRAYLGGGTFGVNGAAQFYFGKSVRDVTLPEAAMFSQVCSRHRVNTLHWPICRPRVPAPMLCSTTWSTPAS